MKNAFLVAALCAALATCTAIPEIAPIPGSITYKGQPSTKLTKAPVGSIVEHRLNDEYGDPAKETYIVQPDRSLRLVRRDRVFDSP